MSTCVTTINLTFFLFFCYVEVIVGMVEGVGGVADVDHSDQGKGDQTKIGRRC